MWQGQCLNKSGIASEEGPCTPPTPISFLQDKAAAVVDAGVKMFPGIPECNQMVRPLADFDQKLGHGNPSCRYEPTPDALLEFAHSPVDIAILLPFLGHISEEAELPDTGNYADFGVHAWRAYARFHNYTFYTGSPSEFAEVKDLCPGLEYRAPHWMKPCMARVLLRKHAYLLIVDTDTFVSKPRLRLEPLFERAGLLTKKYRPSEISIAVAREWGSCYAGQRPPISGDHNGGILLLKQAPVVEDALERWFNEPMDCLPEDDGLLEYRQVKPRDVGWTRWTGYGLIPGNWLETDPHPERCKLLISSLRGWAYDQLGLSLSVSQNPAFQNVVYQFPSGCPLNGPWADFIPHLPSGTVGTMYYDPDDRLAVMRNMHRCVTTLLKTSSFYGADIYERCSLCQLLPEHRRHTDAWTYSCPNLAV
mmetsp:Transcript_139741/g.247038  ORF Transcript_139741/g.247038 Transcript_139741/m.247038 type:complete len:420 (-) Transcript_139741:67-1326(-)